MIGLDFVFKTTTALGLNCNEMLHQFSCIQKNLNLLYPDRPTKYQKSLPVPDCTFFFLSLFFPQSLDYPGLDVLFINCLFLVTFCH